MRSLKGLKRSIGLIGLQKIDSAKLGIENFEQTQRIKH
jgi:hypothetical protein